MTFTPRPLVVSPDTVAPHRRRVDADLRVGQVQGLVVIPRLADLRHSEAALAGLVVDGLRRRSGPAAALIRIMRRHRSAVARLVLLALLGEADSSVEITRAPPADEQAPTDPPELLTVMPTGPPARPALGTREQLAA